MMTAKLYDVDAIRADFPILSREVHGSRLSISTVRHRRRNRVRSWMRTILAYLTYSSVCSLHFLSEASTDAYEAVQGSVASFIGAASGDEIVFTSGVTMALNLIARCWVNAVAAGRRSPVIVASTVPILFPGRWWRKRQGPLFALSTWAPMVPSSWQSD